MTSSFSKARVEAITVQRAEWEDGIPPESTIALTSHTPVFIRLVNIYRHCGLSLIAAKADSFP